MSDPDARLMDATRAGDDAAFAELVQRHGRTLFSYFFFQGRDADLAEDCAQEVWMKIYRARSEYVPRSSFRTYLLSVARNHWIDVYRSRARRATEIPLESALDWGDADGQALLQKLSAAGTPPESAVIGSELADRVARALERLPSALREVFVLGEMEGVPYAEISEILGIPEGTVKSRMFNAVRRLRGWLRDLGAPEHLAVAPERPARTDFDAADRAGGEPLP